MSKIPPFERLRMRLDYILTSAKMGKIASVYKVTPSAVSRNTSGKGITPGEVSANVGILYRLWHEETKMQIPLRPEEFNIIIRAIVQARLDATFAPATAQLS